MSYLPREPAVILTASDVERLWRSAGLEALRLKHRSGDTALYALLMNMHQVRLLRLRDAVDGPEQRQLTALEEREWWTTRQVTTASGRAERTVRKDIADGELAATKSGRSWIIADADARTYIANRKRTA